MVTDLHTMHLKQQHTGTHWFYCMQSYSLPLVDNTFMTQRTGLCLVFYMLCCVGAWKVPHWCNKAVLGVPWDNKCDVWPYLRVSRGDVAISIGHLRRTRGFSWRGGPYLLDMVHLLYHKTQTEPHHWLIATIITWCKQTRPLTPSYKDREGHARDVCQGWVLGSDI